MVRATRWLLGVTKIRIRCLVVMFASACFLPVGLPYVKFQPLDLKMVYHTSLVRNSCRIQIHVAPEQ